MSQQINLFNKQLLKQKQYFTAMAMLQSVVLMMLGSALVYGYAAYQVKLLTVQSAESNRRYAAAQQQLARFSVEYSPQKALKALEEELKFSNDQLMVQRELLVTLKSGVIGNTRGYSEYLRAFARQSTAGLWLTGFDITGDAVQMTLRGGVLSPELVPLFISRLNQEEIMRGREFAALNMQQSRVGAGTPASRPYLEFTLQSNETAGAKQ